MERLVFVTVICFFLLSFVINAERIYGPEKTASIPTVGEQITEARLRKGYSQDNLAKMLSVSVYSIQSIENDKAVLGRVLIDKVQKVLDCELVIDDPSRRGDLAMTH